MKNILMFMMPSCPHCKLAIKYQFELLEAHPEWKEIPFRMVNELAQPELADKYDYYYVPTFYVGKEKVHEGHAEREDVEKVFRAAMEE